MAWLLRLLFLAFKFMAGVCVCARALVRNKGFVCGSFHWIVGIEVSQGSSHSCMFSKLLQ